MRLLNLRNTLPLLLIAGLGCPVLADDKKSEMKPTTIKILLLKAKSRKENICQT